MGCGESAPEDIPTKPTAYKETAAKQVVTTITIKSAQFTETKLRVLIIGSGDTGKSVLSLQLESLYNNIKQEIVSEYLKQIKQVIIADAKAIVNYMEKISIPVGERLADAVIQVKKAQAVPEAFTVQLAQTISSLWVDAGFKTAYLQIASELHENIDTYFPVADKIANNTYQLDNELLLKASIPTVGYMTHQFTINDMNTEIIEIGGNKSQREQWHKTYKGVDLIIYVASLSDFDQNIIGESGVSRSQDSITLFGQLAANPLFAETPIYLVLNKKDVFGLKLLKNFEQFKHVYPGFNNAKEDTEAAVEHVKQAYLRQLDTDRSPNAWVEAEAISALETETVQKLFNTIARKLVELSGKAATKPALTESSKVVAPVIQVKEEEESDIQVEEAPFEETTVQATVTQVAPKSTPAPAEKAPAAPEEKTDKPDEKAPEAKKEKSDDDDDDDSSNESSVSDSGSDTSDVSSLTSDDDDNDDE